MPSRCLDRNPVARGLLLAALAACAAPGTPGARAGEPRMGSPDFKPSPQRPVGWRGDGTGRYPDADPPLHWGRTSKAMKGLRCQAKKPADGKPGGTPMSDGTVREWLVLGPFPAEYDSSMDVEAVPDEAKLSPDENEKTTDGTWKLVATDASALDLNAATARRPNACSTAFVHAYLWSDAPASFRMLINYRSLLRVWVNGSPVGKPWWDEKSPRAGWITTSHAWDGAIKLNQGWNRLLMKVRSFGEKPKTANYPSAFAYVYWYIEPTFYGMAPCEYEETNIRWTARMPGVSPAAPIVASDRLYAVAEPDLLVCLDKESGKVLWVRSNGAFDAIPPEERKANADLQAIEPLAEKLKAIEESFASSPPAAKAIEERNKLRKDITAGLRKVDSRKYFTQQWGEAGCACASPASDGENVYAFFASGVTACYDPAGNRKWIRIEDRRPPEHGLTSSPLLADGKLVIYTGELVALDPKTGKELWRRKCDGPTFHGSITAGNIGGTSVFSLPLGSIHRFTDGKALLAGHGGCGQPIPSAVIDGSTCYSLSTYVASDGATKVGILRVRKLPDTVGEEVKPVWQKEWSAEGVAPVYYCNWFMGSPLVHDGLVYCVDGLGGLHVVDALTGETVYQKVLDLSQCGGRWRAPVGSSPTLAGKHIYAIGSRGATTIVLRPGRKFEQVAKNRIEDVGSMVANPVFDGKRMYLRTENDIHCVEGK